MLLSFQYPGPFTVLSMFSFKLTAMWSVDFIIAGLISELIILCLNSFEIRKKSILLASFCEFFSFTGILKFWIFNFPWVYQFIEFNYLF